MTDREPPGYARCRDCQKQWQERFVDNTGLCTMCGLTSRRSLGDPRVSRRPAARVGES